MDTVKQTTFDFSVAALRTAPDRGEYKTTEPVEARSLSEVIDGMDNVLLFAKTASRSFWQGMKLED